jgi:hypothetical protein
MLAELFEKKVRVILIFWINFYPRNPQRDSFYKSVNDETTFKFVGAIFG